MASDSPLSDLEKEIGIRMAEEVLRVARRMDDRIDGLCAGLLRPRREYDLSGAFRYEFGAVGLGLWQG
jgi:hypothetical protein